MAACGLQHIFDTPLPENPTLLESLSPWNQIKKVKPLDHHRPSFTEIFGELHFNENPPPLPTSSYGSGHKSESLQSESLQMCTEGLGVESSDNVMADFGEAEAEAGGSGVKVNKPAEQSCCRDLRRSRSMSGGGGFPPPISSIGKSGKPWVSFKPYRKDGRFMLKEVRIPTQDVLEACREDGRLKLHFVHEDDENLEEDNYDEQQSEDDEDSDEYSDEENQEKEKEIEAINSVQET